MRRRIVEEKWLTDKDDPSTGLAVIAILVVIWMLAS